MKQVTPSASISAISDGKPVDGRVSKVLQRNASATAPEGRPLKIALIAPPFVAVPPASYGGTEAVVDRLARGLQTQGHDVTLFASSDSTCPVPRGKDMPISHPEATDHQMIAGEYIVKVYEQLQDQEFDIVHDHTFLGPMYARAFPQLRVISTNHGPFNGPFASMFEHCWRWAPVIAISRSQASYATHPIAGVIHHGMEYNDIEVGAGDGGYLLFLGRINRHKGTHHAIEVAKRTGMPLKIAAKVWEPDERRYFEEEIKPHLGSDIEYLGEVGGTAKYDLLRGAAALINPIQWPEPFGLVMIEAAATGTPVIGCSQGAAPEIIQHGVSGFLCKDVDELVSGVNRLDEIDRAACREHVEKEFSIEKMVNAHVDLYERLIQSGAPVVDYSSPSPRRPTTPSDSTTAIAN